MTRHHGRDQHKDDADEYLRRVDETYGFDESSGIYKPIPYYEKHKITHQGNVEVSANTIRTDTSVRRDWIDTVLRAAGFLVSMVTLFLLFLTARYTYNQWQAADKTAKAAICANQIAQNSLTNQKNAFITDQRAWVGFDKATCEKCSNASTSIHISEPQFFVINTGKTPALHAKIDVYPMYKMYPQPPPTFDEARTAKNYVSISPPSEYTLPPGVPVQINVPMFGEHVSNSKDQPFWYVVGRITYFDIYQPKVVHHTSFCTMTGDKFPFGGPLTWHLCSSGNSMD